MPRFFVEFFSFVSVTGFQNVLSLQRVITLRHSTVFQCNLVHEQTALSPSGELRPGSLAVLGEFPVFLEL